MHPVFIVNPRSGRALRALPEVRDYATSIGAELTLTAFPRHASELAARAVAAGCPLVVAVGGDGTLNEVASVLVGTSATLGLVPCGSGNGLGRHLGIHGPIHRALAVLRAGHSRLIDSGLADGHAFFTAAGLGFEAEISQRFNRLVHRGFLRYLSTSAAALRTYRAGDYSITHDGTTTTLRALTIAVANSDQYGNNARIAPGARIDDGLLNLTAVAPIGPLNALPLLARLFSGTLDRAAGITHLRAATFIITRPSPGPIHADGEVHAAGTTVTFAIRPASLRILVPSPNKAH